MKLTCDRCGHTIPPEDIKLALAKCTGCGTVFGFANKVDNTFASGEGGGRSMGPRAPVPMPAGITVDDLGSDLLMTYRWFGAKIIFLTLFCMFWDGFLVVPPRRP